MSSAVTLRHNRRDARWIRLWRYPQTVPVLRRSRCDDSIRYRRSSWHRMQLRSGEERDRAVHKIAPPHEVIATEILISPRLVSRSTPSAPRFQARQMRLNFEVGSSFMQSTIRQVELPVQQGDLGRLVTIARSEFQESPLSLLLPRIPERLGWSHPPGIESQSR